MASLELNLSLFSNLLQSWSLIDCKSLIADSIGVILTHKRLICRQLSEGGFLTLIDSNNYDMFMKVKQEPNNSKEAMQNILFIKNYCGLVGNRGGSEDGEGKRIFEAPPPFDDEICFNLPGKVAFVDNENSFFL